MSAPPKTFKESVLELNRNAKTWEEVEQFIITSAKGMKKSVKVLMGRFENWLKETNEGKAPLPFRLREGDAPSEEEKLYDSWQAEKAAETPVACVGTYKPVETVEQMEDILKSTYKPKKSNKVEVELLKENNLDAPSGCFPHTGKMPKIKIVKSDDKGATWYEPKTEFDIKNLNGKCLCGCEYTPAEGNLFYRGHGRKLKMLYLKFLKSQKELHSLPLETQDYLITRWSGLTV